MWGAAVVMPAAPCFFSKNREVLERGQLMLLRRALALKESPAR
jgi:hypothetical protein